MVKQQFPLYLRKLIAPLLVHTLNTMLKLVFSSAKMDVLEPLLQELALKNLTKVCAICQPQIAIDMAKASKGVLMGLTKHLGKYRNDEIPEGIII